MAELPMSEKIVYCGSSMSATTPWELPAIGRPPIGEPLIAACCQVSPSAEDHTCTDPPHVAISTRSPSCAACAVGWLPKVPSGIIVQLTPSGELHAVNDPFWG